MSRGARFVILCEDKQSQVFIYRALVARGVNRREIHKEPFPSESGGGAGEAFVVAKYPDQVRGFRSRAGRAKTGLVVHVDADPRKTVADRHNQLTGRLEEAGQPRRGPDEAIVELVPKRNTETWIHALDPDLAGRLRQPLDEDLECPKLSGNERACAPAAAAFAHHARNGTTPPIATSIPSLADGLGEFRRLEALL